MSWIETPCKIIPAINNVIEAINERCEFVNIQPALKRIDVPFNPNPYGNHVFTKKIDEMYGYISRFYRNHYPVHKFDSWCNPCPFIDSSDDEIKTAISNELMSVNIDPSCLFSRPSRIGNTNLIMAYYHLLNNVLLYFPRRFFKISFPSGRYYTSNNELDEYITAEVLAEPLSECSCEAADKNPVSKHTYYLAENENRHITPVAVDYYEANRMNIIGEFGVRYTTWVLKDAGDIIYEEVTVPGVTEIKGHAEKGCIMPWSNEVTSVFDDFRQYIKKYRIVTLNEYNTLTEVFLTKNSLQSLPYKYLDK